MILPNLEVAHMDTARYVLAVLLVISLPPAVAYWYVFHPFAAFWRRRGRWLAFGTQVVLFAVIGTSLYRLRAVLVVGDLGTNPWLIIAALPLGTAALTIATARRKHLTQRILVGLPEVDPKAYPGTLLQEGIYAHIRHPRYVEFTVGAIAWALVINYTAVYLVVGLTILTLLGIVPLEERELVARFGQAYQDYRERVPRFVPGKRR